jgi:hypothetical protein
MPNEIPVILHKAHIKSLLNVAPNHPVFRLMWNDGRGGADRPFIIKGDSGSKETMASAYGLMREAARGVRWRVLDASETRWLFEVADTKSVDGATKIYMAKLQAAGYTWVIMGNKDALLQLEDVIQKNDSATAAAMLMALGDEENLHRLGAILVVDMFTNNADRFKVKPGEQGIQNMGNVFFVRKGDGTLRIKGLDPFDWTKSNSLLETTVSTSKDPTDGGWWSGIMLRKDAELERVARAAATSLNQELGAVMRRAGYQENAIQQLSLGKREIGKVVDGMKAARKKVENACHSSVGRMAGNTKAQAGMLSRMRALGWV